MGFLTKVVWMVGKVSREKACSVGVNLPGKTVGVYSSNTVNTIKVGGGHPLLRKAIRVRNVVLIPGRRFSPSFRGLEKPLEVVAQADVPENNVDIPRDGGIVQKIEVALKVKKIHLKSLAIL